MRGAVLKSRIPLALFGVLLLAGGLRFYGLGIQSLWVDELASVWFAGPGSVAEVVERTVGDVHPPGYHLVLHLSMTVFGDAEWAVRLPSAVAGWLAVYVVFLLGRELYSTREGLAGALLTAVFFSPVYYAQEARSYSLLLLFSALTALLWWRVFRGFTEGGRPGGWTVLGYVAAATICCYLHYFGLFIVAFQGAAMFWAVGVFRLRSVFGVIVVYVPIGLAYLPWAFVMPGQARDREPGATAPGLYADFLFNSSPAMTLIAALLFFGLFAVSLPALGAVRSVEGFGRFMPGLLLVGWLTVPFGVAWIISEYATPILSARNMIVASPAAYLLLARAIVVLAPNARLQTALAVGVAGLSLYQVVFTDELYSRVHKQQVREAVAFVTDRRENDPLVVHCGVGREANYYYRAQGSDRSEFSQVGACEAERMAAVLSAGAEHGEIILVYAHLRPSEELLRAMSEEYRPVTHRDLYDAGAFLYRNPAGQGTGT
ncbi:glycosyltransferase family 39 protein [Rubrobacter indicoceani]|uniref:glycosyltransferase family 39 protein n=1 Tax=Rubrobacter indicoceani TaxID=2051957 RepID=UPI0013C45CFC|nr:glycosyltransferase family 39 protein [Rubrobacter indicoceani]